MGTPQWIWQSCSEEVAARNSLGQNQISMHLEYFQLLYALLLETVGFFLLHMLMLVYVELLPSTIDGDINKFSWMSSFKSGFIVCPEIVPSFLMGMEVHPKLSNASRTMVTCLASVSHFLWGAGLVFFFNLSLLILPQKPCSVVSNPPCIIDVPHNTLMVL